MKITVHVVPPEPIDHERIVEGPVVCERRQGFVVRQIELLEPFVEELSRLSLWHTSFEDVIVFELRDGHRLPIDVSTDRLNIHVERNAIREGLEVRVERQDADLNNAMVSRLESCRLDIDNGHHVAVKMLEDPPIPR